MYNFKEIRKYYPIHYPDLHVEAVQIDGDILIGEEQHIMIMRWMAGFKPMQKTDLDGDFMAQAMGRFISKQYQFIVKHGANGFTYLTPDDFYLRYKPVIFCTCHEPKPTKETGRPHLYCRICNKVVDENSLVGTDHDPSQNPIPTK